MNKAIVNVAVGGGHYQRTQQRLIQCLDQFGETSRLIHTGTLPPGCPSHQEQPFAFKPYVFKQAREMGYTHALWMDVTMKPLKPLDAIWEMLDRDGVFFWNGGWWSGQWCSERMIKGMGLTFDEAWKIPMIQASVIGLKFDSDRGFLDQWLDHVHLFHGAWTNENGQVSSDPRCTGHRHDQSVAGILVHRLFPDLKMVEPPLLTYYPNSTPETWMENRGP